MTAGSSMLAMIRTAPPQREQVSISIWNTRLSRCAQVMAAWRSAAVLGEPGPRRGPRRAGVTCARRLWLGANTPLYVETAEIHTRGRDQCGEPGNKIARAAYVNAYIRMSVFEPAQFR